MMNRKEEERILIDRYLSNALSGLELKEFMDRLESDPEFRKEVVFQNLIVEAIRAADQQRLEGKIIETISYKKPAIPLGLRLIILFMIITGSGILLWQYVGTGTITDEGKPKFSFNIFRQKPKTPVVKEKKKEIVVADTSTIAPEPETEVHENPEVNADTNSTLLTPEEEVVVKKDQLLVTIPMKPIPLDNTKEDKTLAQSTADKLNPSAGLPDMKEIESLQVEFWISPVNYRGYKMYNDKLILFGIEEPDAVRLYSYNNNILMKYGKDFYRLQTVYDFVSFNQIKDTNLPAALR